MREEVIEKFLTAPVDERLRMAKNVVNADVLKDYLGRAAFEEYRRLADRLDEAHLSVKTAKNLIFVPGVMGSLLQSQTKGGIWWIDVRTRAHIDDLRLSPDGLEDADPDNQVVASTVDTSYEPFLTAILARDDFGHLVFPYDWRKPLTSSSSALKDLVLKTYETNGNKPVHLVAHSMGGLVVRATLMRHGDEIWSKVGRIVFIGTPHYGSPAIAGYLKNHLWGFDLMSLLGVYLSRSTYRSLWGVLSMLPAPQGIYPGTRPHDPHAWRSPNPEDPYVHPCANFNLFRADQWKLDLTFEQETALQKVLDGAAEFHKQMYESHNALDQSLRDRMLVIAGVGYKTLFRLAYDSRFFGLWEYTDKVTDRIKGDPHREGDGRVPLASAALENVLIRFVKGVHGGLPNIPEVYDDVFHWLKEESVELPDDVDGALSQHLAPGAGDSEAPHLDGTVRKVPFTDDPGLWNATQPQQPQLADLDLQLASGQIQEFINVRLL